MTRAALLACFLAVIASLPPSPAAFFPGVRLTPDELAAREEKAGQDPLKLLLLSGMAEDSAARRLRQQVHKILSGERKTATAAELNARADRMAAILPSIIRSDKEALEVLGPPARVSRQILFRRYVELWTYETPLPLLVEFDFRKGQDAHLLAAQVNRSKKPNY